MAHLAQIGPDHLRHHPIFNRVLTRRSQPHALGPWVDLAGHSHTTHPSRLPNSVSRSTNLKGPGRVSRSVRHAGLSWLAASSHSTGMSTPSITVSIAFVIIPDWPSLERCPGYRSLPAPHDQAWLAPISISRHASRVVSRSPHCVITWPHLWVKGRGLDASGNPVCANECD